MAPYSARNKVPNIQTLGKELAERLNLQKQDASRAAAGKDQDKVQKAKDASRRRVVDPTTKNEVVIQDVDGDFEASIRRPLITVPKANVDPKQPPLPNILPGVPTPHLPEGHGEAYRETLDDLAPPEANPDKTDDYLHHSKNIQVIYHPLPVADLKASFYALESAINQASVAIVVGIVVLNWLFVSRGFKGLFASIFAGVIIACGVHLWLRKIQEDANALNWESERQRAEAATESLVPESVEWMNSLVGIIWKLINPEMFAAMADTLEDVMQASVPPSIVQNVRVSSIGQGVVPFKILSLRALPSADEDDGHGKSKANGTELSPEEKAKKKEERELEGEDDDSNRYYNLEASFAYKAAPAKGVIGKAMNMHLELVFYLGIKGLFDVPLPVFVELNGIIGTVRLRFQLTPNPPFLKNLTFTFMGLPKIDASAVPMTSKGINVLDLPLISGFVNSSIAAALDEYVAPKSLIMDMSKILQGDAVKKETDAIGVLYIRIKNAEGISAQDRSGKSDPFITLAYSQYGSPQYCTRIIEQELNPSWNEQTCLLVYQEQLTAGEKLSVELWDSDKITSDDVVGKVSFDLRQLIKEDSGKIMSRSDELKDEKGEVLPGKLNWDIGYFCKSDWKNSMKSDGKDTALAKELRDHPDLQDDKGVVVTEDEKAITTTPPDPTLPTGICSVLIHQIDNLEVHRPSGSFGSYEPWTPAQITGENTDEEGDRLPSSYCTVLCNDQLVFRTRTKVSSSAPIFNAQTERFIRDWRNAVITVSARNAQNREHDALLGSVTLKLSEILRNSSQSTGIYSLDGGMGYGRITISLLFRSVDLRLPPNLLGWDIGSLEVLGDAVNVSDDGAGYLSKTRIAVHSDVAKRIIHRHWINPNSPHNGTTWDLKRIKQHDQGGDGLDLQKRRVMVPVRERYKSPMRVEFFSEGHRKPIAYAIYWLTDLVDNQETVLEIPIHKTPMPKQMTQNYIANIEADKNVATERCGTLRMTVRFKMGLDESHGEYMRGNDDRETMETWESVIAEGTRTRIVKRELPDVVKQMVKDGKVKDNADAEDDTDAASLADAEQDEEEDEDVDIVRVPRNKPGYEKEIDDYHATDSGAQWEQMFGGELSKYTSTPSQSIHEDDEDLRLQEDVTDSEIDDEDLKKRRQRQDKRAQKHELQRKHRGLQGIKAVRNLKFLKDETKVLGYKIKNRFSMKGREPGVETEL
ncbi:C2 domain protein [Protomyces lactucae-debilis]|uniref:C2 domain protein n=1 Tax=Protomyces lactucae-debilis TaxID=2754530 RepID=A0A1Y2F0Z5_PROLT|nr:C2 domain protein [Protomyces lactucae-debilis]ORY77377.1 C2 domain protein [Protomyces lactucae-debilis]